MADKRAFATFDVGYLDNPKIMDVFDASPIAVCMHFASVLYCAQHLTDGLIALRAMQRKVGGSDVDSKLLIDADLWHLPGHDCPNCPEVPAGKAYVHDYLEHNRSSEGVKGKSDTGRRAAEARWGKGRSGADSNAKRMQDASETHSEPQYGEDDSAMPRQTDRKTEEKPSPDDNDAKKPTRIPKDWVPTKAHIDAAKKKGVDVMDEAENFRLHAETHDRRCASWNGAFASWLKKSKPKANTGFDPRNWMNQ